MKIGYLLPLLLSTSMALAAGGCTLLDREQSDPPRAFQLRAPETVPAEVTGEGVLAVMLPTADPPYQTREMAYRQSPVELRYFARNHWADAPAAMLAQAVTDALARSGLFKAVVAAPTPVQADYRLAMHLSRLEQDFTGAPPSRARLAVRVHLIDSATGELLGSRQLDLSAPAPTADPEGGAIAANRAVAELIDRVLALCREVIRTGNA